MAGRGGFPMSRSQKGEDRSHNPWAVRRQPHNQQQQQQLLSQEQSTWTIPPAFLPPSTPDGIIFPPPPPLPPQTVMTNLNHLLDSLSPTVPAKNFLEVNSMAWRGRATEFYPYFSLGDLWEAFRERSVYGVGAPLVLNQHVQITQYFVPYLSGIQLYVDPLKTLQRPSRQSSVVEELESRENEEGSSAHGSLAFEYFESEQPYLRPPLTDKVLVLESHFPELRTFKSYELLPTSWLCVAWYPIYRIPEIPQLKDLEASFLTFHSLSTNFRTRMSGQSSASCSSSNGQYVESDISATDTLTLPAFGLVSYKLKGSILTPSGPHECQLENDLLQAAGKWLEHMQVNLPDHQFFLSQYRRWR